MSQKHGIFIFTKDRPSSLNKTLLSLPHGGTKIFIIDDSAQKYNQVANRELCEEQNNFNYLGQSEFAAFLERNNIDESKFLFLLRKLGNDNWNLGYARNFALLLSKSWHMEKVLFMDDDIQVPSLEVISNVFNLTNTHDFVGAHITGMEDHSIVQFIANDLGVVSETMLSGGFLLFNPNEISNYFMNIYNEDWIWLYLEFQNKTFLQNEEVIQSKTDPFDNYQKKIIFQEFGEIVVDGILEIYQEGLYETLLLLDFWKRMVDERQEYLTLLLELVKEDDHLQYVPILKWLIRKSDNFRAEEFCALFTEYFDNRSAFQKLYEYL